MYSIPSEARLLHSVSKYSSGLLCHARAARHLDRNVGLEIVVSQVAAREIRRAHRQPEPLGAVDHRELGVELLPVSAVPADVDGAVAGGDQLTGDGLVRNPGLGAPERILVGIHDQAHDDAAAARCQQRFDHRAIRQVEHGDVDVVAALGGIQPARAAP